MVAETSKNPLFYLSQNEGLFGTYISDPLMEWMEKWYIRWFRLGFLVKTSTYRASCYQKHDSGHQTTVQAEPPARQQQQQQQQQEQEQEQTSFIFTSMDIMLKTNYIHWWYEWTRYWAWFKLNVNRQLHASRMDLLVLVTGDRGVVWESKTDTCKSKNHNYHVIISPLTHIIGFHRFKPRK